MESTRPLVLARLIGVGLIVGGGVLLGLAAIDYGQPALYSPAGAAAVVAGIAAVRGWRARWVTVAIVGVAGSLFIWEWLFRASSA